MIISKRVMKYISIIITAAAVVALMFAVKRPAAADDPHQDHKVCVGSACTDPSHNDVVWSAWASGDTPPTSGTYYLSGNVNLSSTITLTGDLTLCLNGNSISGSTTKFIVPVSKTLNICDCSNTPGSLTGATDCSAVRVEGGTFNLYSGIISGNTMSATSDNGCGVYVKNSGTTGGTFNMYGGEISNNTTAGVGGGVYVEGYTGSQGRGAFNMHGGTISGNYAKSGGGVYVTNTDFTMHGGTISENHSTYPYSFAVGNHNGGGGGVWIEKNCKFTMKSGSVITKNDANNEGGGVYTEASATFIMEGGEISYNQAARGGGVFSMSSGGWWSPQIEFKIEGGEISHNTATNEGGGGVYNYGTFTMNGGTISENKAVNKDGGGVYNHSTFTMSEGTISENKAESGNGGGVYNRGTFTMEKDNNTGTVGTISGNITKNGGGVYTAFYSTFTMNNGTISGNEATENGGGIYATTESESYSDRSTSVIMKDGTVSNNTAAQNGGGVCVISAKPERVCSFEMSGGTISNNEVNQNGGGVYLSSNSLLTVNNAVEITENKKIEADASTTETGGDDNNVYLCTGQKITIGNDFDKDGSTIGVTVEAPPNNCQSVVQVTTGGTIGDEVGFRSDEEDCDVEDNENVVDVQLIGQHRWNSGTIAIAPTCMAAGSKEVTCTLCSTNATLTMDIVDHDFNTSWYNEDETEHWHFCTYECGTKNDVAVHNWNGGVETIPATTDTEGVMTFTCTVCTRTKTELIPKLSEGGNNPGNNNPSSRPSNNNSSGSVPSQSENPSTSEINTSSGDNSNPSESSPTANNGNPSTGITVSILPLTLTATALTVASKRKNLKK